MTLALQVHVSARAFLDRAQPWLLRREAEHNLLLGIAERLTAYDELPADVLLVTVEQDGEVVGCAFRTPPWKLGLTDLPRDAIAALADLVAAHYDALPAVLGPEPIARRFAEAWSRHTGVTATPGMRQRIFQTEAVREPPQPPPGNATSNAIYQRIGYEPVCDVMDFNFESYDA